MTNYGTLAILALPKMPERQLRLLLAIETITQAPNGHRYIGAPLLASKAGLSPRTVRRARDELVQAGRITYTQGNGRGHVSGYRLLIAIKGGNDTDHLYEEQRWPAESVKVASHANKGGHQNGTASTNANSGLKASGLDTSGLEASAIRPPNRRAKNEDPAPVDDLLSRLRREMGWTAR